MTKRNLLLVSLFLVFGLAAMAPSALASVSITFGALQNFDGRGEGLAEATGSAVFTATTPGTLGTGSYLTITYTAPITEIGTVVVTTVGVTTCAMAPTLSSADVLKLPVGGCTFATNATITVLVRLDVHKTAPGIVTATGGGSLSGGGLTGVLTQTVMTVNPVPALSLGYDAYKNNGVTAAQVLTCIGVKDVATYENEFIINVDENFPSALTTSTEEVLLDPGSASPGFATNGSDFTITFSGVPAGVGMALVDNEPCYTLSTKDPLYSTNCGNDKGGGTLTVSLISAAAVSAPTTSGTISFTFAPVTMDIGSPESVSLSFKFWSHGPLAPASTTGLTQITANVAYSPTLATDVPYFTGAPEATPSLPVVDFSDCVTNLLFPYVNAFTVGGTAPFSNFGTGIVFANTTSDPFTVGSAVPQNGSCTLYLYPATAGSATGNTSPITYPTGTILSGGSTSFDVAIAVPKFKGLTGYGIAICNFQNAHAFAEIYDNYGIGAPTATLAYLADVLPDPTFYHRSPAGDGLGESAIAPIAVSKFIEKLLFYGVHNGAGR